MNALARLRTALSDRRAPFVVVGALASLYLLPIWIPRFLVMQDLSAHVEMSCQVLRLWQGDPAFVGTVELQRLPWPNALPNLLLAALLAVFPGYVAAKVALSLYVLAWPLSVAWLFQAFGRSPWLALIALPTTLDMTWAYGFFNFILAKPLWCLALVATRRFAVDGGWKSGALLTASLVALFHGHSFLWALALVQAPIVGLLKATSWKRVLLGVVPFSISGLAAYPFWDASHAQNDTAKGKYFASFGEAWAQLWPNLGELNASSGDETAWRIAGAALLVAIAAALLRNFTELTRDRLAMLIVGLVAAYAYVEGPLSLPHTSIIAQRFPVFALVALVGVVPAPTHRVALAIATLMGAAVVVHVADTTRMYRGFSDQEMGDFTALIDEAPEGGRLATAFPAGPQSKWGKHAALWHWPKLHCVHGRGYTDDLFAYRTHNIVTVTAAAKARGFVAYAPGNDVQRLKKYDALLVRGDERHVAALKDHLEPLGTSGTWRLYRVKK